MNLREAAQQALDALEEYEKSYQAVADGLKPLRAALADTQDWDEVEALRASLREHMAEIRRLRAAGRQALDAMDYTRWAVADYAQKWGMPRFDRAMNTLRDALAEDVPPASEELNESSLNKLVEDLKKLGSLNKFKPTHMLFNAKALEYRKKLERDDPETNFVNHTLAVHVGYRYQSPVGGWEYGDHIPAGFDTQKWAHQKIYILQEQS